MKETSKKILTFCIAAAILSACLFVRRWQAEGMLPTVAGTEKVREQTVLGEFVTNIGKYQLFKEMPGNDRGYRIWAGLIFFCVFLYSGWMWVLFRRIRETEEKERGKRKAENPWFRGPPYGWRKAEKR